MAELYNEEGMKLFMLKALKMAQKAFDHDEVPVGCIIVFQEKIIARAYNRVETDDTQCSHAELLALRKAGKKLGDWRLLGCDLYVTLEPCAMCMHAIRLHRLARVIYGAHSPVYGYQLDKEDFDSLYKNDTLHIISGILQDESAQLLKQFFTDKRRKDDK